MFHRCAVLTVFLAGLIFSHIADAQAGGPETAAPHKERTQLTGDWGGARTSLAQHGIIVDIQATQFYQSVVDGSSGTDNWQYGVKGDLFLTLIGEQLGLWKGLNASIHVESRAGDDVNALTGLSPGNANMLMPDSGDTTAITQFMVSQMLGPQAMLSVGKFNGLDLFDMAFHSGRGIDRFMNASLVLPLGVGRTAPLSFMGAAAIKLKGREVQGALVAYDPNDSATTSGFDPLFDDVALLGIWKFFHDSRHGGRPGYISIGGTWSDKDYTVVGPLKHCDRPGTGPRLHGRTGLLVDLFRCRPPALGGPLQPEQRTPLYRTVHVNGWRGKPDRLDRIRRARNGWPYSQTKQGHHWCGYFLRWAEQ
jgi:hypothetical protein